MEQEKTEEHYRRICQQLIIDEEKMHEMNLKKIKIGIQCLFWIPLVFLAMLFLTDGSKVIFLVLWIASLFGIAAYLIYIEYTDFLEQEKVRRYKEEEGMNANLIGTEVEAFEESVDDLLTRLDEKKAENKERVRSIISQRKDKLLESLPDLKKGADRE